MATPVYWIWNLVHCAKGRIETVGVCEDSAGNNIWTWETESKKKAKKIHDVGKANPGQALRVPGG